MKSKIVAITALVMSTVMLCSCSSKVLAGLGKFGEGVSMIYFAIAGSDETKSIDKLEELIAAVEEQDIDTISSLFSENTREKSDTFDDSVKELIEYYTGSYLSTAIPQKPHTSRSRDGDAEERIIHSFFDVSTSECSYRISMMWTEKDTKDGKNVGINSLYIINAEDDINLSTAYSGDGKETPGINIGVQNTWPDEMITGFDDTDVLSE